jgi:hypothetical protein
MMAVKRSASAVAQTSDATASAPDAAGRRRFSVEEEQESAYGLRLTVVAHRLLRPATAAL